MFERSDETHWLSSPALPAEVGRPSVKNVYSRGGKRAADICFAMVMLPTILPLLILLLPIVALDGHSPIYRHERLGRHGKRFHMLKIRTMRPDAERHLVDVLRNDPTAALEWSRTRKLRNDPRVTSLGRFLRQTSLDELPQLLNVLKGDMSLVGPRPVTEAEIGQYGALGTAVLELRPGLTGAWQVKARGHDHSFETRVALDVAYLRSVTFVSDVRIILRTAKAVFDRTGS